MRILLFLLLFELSFRIAAQDSYYKFVYFANVGQTLPLGAFSADKNSDDPLEIAIKDDFARSFRMGFEFYPTRRLGLTVGSSIINFKLDKAVFEGMHNPNSNLTESYLRNYYCTKVHAGLTSRFTVKMLSIEPKFTLGIVSVGFNDAEFYLQSSGSEIYKTINYEFSTRDEDTFFWLSYNGALNITYELIHWDDGISIGLQLFSELTFMNPMIRQFTTESNRNTDIILSTEKLYRQPVAFFYYGVGLVLKSGRIIKQK